MNSSTSSSENSPLSSADPDVESHFYHDLVNSKPPLMTKSPSLHKVKQEGNYSKVLVIYTGGTIGMMRTEKGVYAPVESEMEKKIKTYPQLHDKEAADEYNLHNPGQNVFVLPYAHLKNV